MSVQLQSIVGKQIPDFITADYPAFVEFFQAYYEYLQNQKLDIFDVRDVDNTLESFIKHFRKELDVLGDNYPYIDQRLFLRKSKQLFTSKGAEASYKLLFKMLYNKEANITLPWDSVLKPSDGKWQQDASLFVRLTAGNANHLVGNNVDIIGLNTNITVFVQFINTIEEEYTSIAGTFVKGTEYTITSVGNTNFVAIGADSNIVGLSFIATGSGSGTGTAVYKKYVNEIFINKDYNGKIETGYTLEYIQKVVTFDAITNVDITKNTITVYNHEFSTGDNVVYTYSGGLSVGGLGTTSSYYIIKVDDNTVKLAISEKNAIDGQNIILSAKGIGPAHILKKSIRGEILPTVQSYKVLKPGSGFAVGDLIQGSTVSEGKIITQLMKVTRIDSNGGILALDTIRFGYGYANDFYVLNPSGNVVKTSSSKITVQKPVGTDAFTLDNDSVIEKYADYGYIINPNYVEFPADRPAYTDISYVATLLNQFYNELKTQLGNSVDFCLLSFQVGPVAKYPGHFTSNDGFLDDDIYIQDSYRWQKLSYVISADARLEEYKSIVKAILHPAGTALFAEYLIDNSYITNRQTGGNFNPGTKYTIISPGTTDFTKIGALANTVGTRFTATGNGSGTGIADFDRGEQVLAQWQSLATFKTINTTISTNYTYPVDAGGWFRIDAYDEGGYCQDTQLWNPPLTGGKAGSFAAT